LNVIETARRVLQRDLQPYLFRPLTWPVQSSAPTSSDL
jgi:hypothetical protein